LSIKGSELAELQKTKETLVKKLNAKDVLIEDLKKGQDVNNKSYNEILNKFKIKEQEVFKLVEEKNNILAKMAEKDDEIQTCKLHNQNHNQNHKQNPNPNMNNNTY